MATKLMLMGTLCMCVQLSASDAVGKVPQDDENIWRDAQARYRVAQRQKDNFIKCSLSDFLAHRDVEDQTDYINMLDSLCKTCFKLKKIALEQ